MKKVFDYDVDNKLSRQENGGRVKRGRFDKHGRATIQAPGRRNALN